MFARCLLCVFCFVTLIGCGTDRNIVEEDEHLDNGSDVSDTISPDSYSGDVPVVTLVIDKFLDDADSLKFQYHLKIDRPLTHSLFVYVEENEMSSSFSSTWDTTEKYLLYVPVGKIKSWTYWIRHSNASVLMMRILPADMRHGIELPTLTRSGRRDLTVPGTNNHVRVPLGHQFKPYRIGHPSQIVRKRDEIDRGED